MERASAGGQGPAPRRPGGKPAENGLRPRRRPAWRTDRRQMEDGPTADGGGGVRIARPGLESRQEAVRTHTGLEMVEALRKGRSSDRPGRQGRGGLPGHRCGARERERRQEAPQTLA